MQQITQEQLQLISQTLVEFPDGTEFAVTLVENKEATFFGAMLTQGSIQSEANENQFFEIGSITKLFTSVILVNVLEKHGISLDQDINPFLDIQIHNNELITFRTLANHTSGLPDYPESIDFDESSYNPFVHFKKQDFFKFVNNELLIDNEKKGQWSYSNIGFAILGYVICLIEKKSFRALLEEHVFSKYNMPHSTCDREEIKGKIVSGQNSKGEPVPPWGFAEMDEPTGAVLSNVYELSNFVLANFTDNNLALKKVRKKTHEGEDLFDVALGCGILKSKKYHFGAGGTRGHRSMLMLDEVKKKGVIILSNVSCYHKDNRLINELAIELMDSIRSGLEP